MHSWKIDFSSLADKRAEKLRQKYNLDISPDQYLVIDPCQIEQLCAFHQKTKLRYGHKLYDIFRIKDGDWDLPQNNSYLDNYIVYKAVSDRINKGLSWVETGVIDAKLEEIAKSKKGVIDGCRNITELNERYRRVDLLIEDISKNGFRSKSSEEGIADEIFVSIGRDGRYLFASGGNHRLAIAKALKLDAIPFRICMMHADFIRNKALIKKLNLSDCF